MSGENPSTEKFVIIVSGAGYQTGTVAGRAEMEHAFVRAHWPDVDFVKLDEEQQQLLTMIQDEDEWGFEPDLGRTTFVASYEDGQIAVYRLTDDLVGVEPKVAPHCPTCQCPIFGEQK